MRWTRRTLLKRDTAVAVSLVLADHGAWHLEHCRQNSGFTARWSDLASRSGFAHATAVVHDERCHLLFGDVCSRTTDEKTWSAQKHASLSESSHASREQQRPKIHATKCAAISAPRDHHLCETTIIQDTRRKKVRKHGHNVTERLKCSPLATIFSHATKWIWNDQRHETYFCVPGRYSLKFHVYSCTVILVLDYHE